MKLKLLRASYGGSGLLLAVVLLLFTLMMRDLRQQGRPRVPRSIANAMKQRARERKDAHTAMSGW